MSDLLKLIYLFTFPSFWFFFSYENRSRPNIYESLPSKAFKDDKSCFRETTDAEVYVFVQEKYIF